MICSPSSFSLTKIFNSKPILYGTGMNTFLKLDPSDALNVCVIVDFLVASYEIFVISKDIRGNVI